MLININKQEFTELCAKLNLSPNEANSLALRAYLELLLKWNNKINLTGAASWQEALSNLVADSFYLAEFLTSLNLLSANPQIWDLGAGAGLPGIPLRIIWHQGDYHLVESREKRALFLRVALLHLNLANTFAHAARAEEFMAKQCKKGSPANCIISRAFMPWQELTDYVKPYLAPGGILLLMLNGENFTQAIAGWKIVKHSSYSSPNGPRQFLALRLA